MSDNKAKVTRFHFSVPTADKQLNEWLANQYNLSASIRVVLKNYISRYGIADAACLPAQFNDEAAAVYNGIPKTQSEKIDNQADSDIESLLAENNDESIVETKPEPKTTEPVEIDDMLADLMK